MCLFENTVPVLPRLNAEEKTQESSLRGHSCGLPKKAEAEDDKQNSHLTDNPCTVRLDTPSLIQADVISASA